MPKNAETVSRRPKIVIVWHNQCQAEPMSSPCRYPRHQSDRFRNSTLMTGVGGIDRGNLFPAFKYTGLEHIHYVQLKLCYGTQT